MSRASDVLFCLQYDAEMEKRVTKAAAAGNKLVYIGSVDMASGACSVSLEARHFLDDIISKGSTTCNAWPLRPP